MAEVLYEVAEGVARITLNALDRRNALTLTMSKDLVDAFGEADRDLTVGAIVLTGQESFCAGADLGVLAGENSDPASDESYRTTETLYSTFTTIGSVGPAVVAAVRGPAVGAGLNMALAADLRIVANNARLMSGFARIGLHPGGGHFALLDRAGGRTASAGIGLFGQEIEGVQAVALGIAWQALDDGAVEARADELARRIARDPELARRMTASFRLTTGRSGGDWRTAIEVERGPQMWSFRRRAQ